MNGTSQDRLPVASLLALAMAAFITILTEALPAGLLPQMAQGLAVTEAWVGQTVTLYAIGSLVAAIPLTAATQGMHRRPCCWRRSPALSSPTRSRPCPRTLR